MAPLTRDETRAIEKEREKEKGKEQEKEKGKRKGNRNEKRMGARKGRTDGLGSSALLRLGERLEDGVAAHVQADSVHREEAAGRAADRGIGRPADRVDDRC